MTVTRSSIPQTAAWLLGRELTSQDGISETTLAAAERRLGAPIPAPLRDLYRTVGRVPALMSSFQHFLAPRQLDWSEQKLVFLDENQNVCCWATDAQSRVFQTVDPDAPEWFEEREDLAEFLRILLYYQMAQGGYPHCGMIPGDEFADFPALHALIAEMGGRPVVDISELKIWTIGNQALVWFLHNEGEMPESLFLSVLDKDTFEQLCERWSFDDLG